MRALVSLILTALVSTSALAALPEAPDARGRTFRLDDDRGRVVVLTVVSRYTRRDAERLNEALEPYASGRVDVVSVIDFVGIPHLFHGFARRKIREASQNSNIRFLVDVPGQWRRYFGVAPDQRVDIIVIDGEGAVRGRFAARDVDAALRLIRALAVLPYASR
jgi:hypothetical protein